MYACGWLLCVFLLGWGEVVSDRVLIDLPLVKIHKPFVSILKNEQDCVPVEEMEYM